MKKKRKKKFSKNMWAVLWSYSYMPEFHFYREYAKERADILDSEKGVKHLVLHVRVTEIKGKVK